MMWRILVTLCLCLQIASALTGRQKMAIFQRHSCRSSTGTGCAVPRGGVDAVHHAEVSVVRLMAKAAGGGDGEASPPKKKRAAKKKKATSKKKTLKAEKVLNPIEPSDLDISNDDLVATPIDADLDALLSEDFGSLLKDLDDGGDKPAPKKRGRKKKVTSDDDSPVYLDNAGLDDFPADMDLDMDLTEKDIEEALAGIESGDFDVMKFLSDNDSDKESGDRDESEEDPTLKVRTGDPNFSPELLSTLTAETGGEGGEGDVSIGVSSTTKGKKAAPGIAPPAEEDPMVIDGVKLDSDEFDIGDIDPPPLEEFKKLMDSLDDQGSMFEDDELLGFGAEDEEEDDDGLDQNGEVWYGNAEDGFYKAPAKGDNTDYTHPKAKPWLPVVYDGGKPWRSLPAQQDLSEDLERWLTLNDKKADWRVQIVSVVTNSSANSTALEIVGQVYDFIKDKTDNDERIEYLTYCVTKNGDEPVEELEDQVQMWLEGYNTYHLVDGAAMKEAWGGIMPHIMLSENNLNAIVKQVQWALSEDSLNGCLLTPRLRRTRFRGGASEMIMGYNTENLDSEFSVVSVR